MKNTKRFCYTLHIPNVCDLSITGIAYCYPDNDFRDRFDWDIDEVEYGHEGIGVNIRDFAMYAYGDEIDEALYPYVVSLFGYNPDDEDTTTDMRQDEMPDILGAIKEITDTYKRPEIFGELTDLNPEYGC